MDPIAGPSQPRRPAVSIDLTDLPDDDDVDQGTQATSTLPSSSQRARSPQPSSSSASIAPSGPSSSTYPISPHRPPGPPGHSTSGYSSSLPPSYSALGASHNGMNGTSHPSIASPAAPSTQNGSRYLGQTSNGSNGTSADLAIDLTASNLPSPPPVEKKTTVCVGALRTRAIMLYPSPAAVIGAMPPPGSKERFTVITYMGSELLQVKLKLRTPESRESTRNEPWTSVKKSCIQVLTPHRSCYIGDLDNNLAEKLIPLMEKGILRLDGFAQRLQPESYQFEVKLNIHFFTLNTNVSWLRDDLLGKHIFLEHPNPPYDPARHADQPMYRYINDTPHARAFIDEFMRLQYAQANNYQLTAAQVDKTKQVEMQRQQVDEVFKSMEHGGDIEESIPGTMVKTSLFRHQRQALTYLLEREHDKISLKEAQYKFQRMVEKNKKKKPSGKDKGAVTPGPEEEEVKAGDKSKGKKTSQFSLWDGLVDEKGRVRSWKNKISGETVRSKHKPSEGKGAILADDMGLGKTLSIISLIVATRLEARRWSDLPLEDDDTPEEEADDNDVSSMTTRVYGMPDAEAESSQSRKRKLEVPDSHGPGRRARIVKRSRATLLVSPMSTIANWQEQIQQHWDGKFEISGGPGTPANKDLIKAQRKDEDDFETLRVYIYHGANRRMDPNFLADFDVVITSYNTLALEFSKQGGPGIAGDETPTAGTGTNSDEDDVNVPIHGAVRPEVQQEIASMEISDALLRKKKAGKAASKEQTSPLQAVDWFRVVLDEAHYIKSAKTIASQAACDLAADRRIAVTGTPIQNKIEDVWALFRFLRLEPVADKDSFNKWINHPCKIGDPVGLARLQLVMGCCSIRRTKESHDENGKKILELPQRTERQVWLEFDEDERKVYTERKQKVKDAWETMQAEKEDKEEGRAKGVVAADGTGASTYSNILHELLILRQTCNHVDLVQTGVVEEDYNGTIMDFGLASQGIEKYGFNPARSIAMVTHLKEASGARCRNCKEDIGDYFPTLGLDGDVMPELAETEGKPKKKIPWKPILTKCHHIFCPKCFKAAIYSDWSARKQKTRVSRQCPCGRMLKLPEDVTEVLPPGADDKEFEAVPATTVKRKKFIRPAGEPLVLSTKMKWLYQELMSNSRRNPFSKHFDASALTEGVEEVDKDGVPLAIKSVVFSQWTTMLDRISDMLDEMEIPHSRLDGTMALPERQEAMDQLKKNRKVEVILISTRAGGVGLNLTSACRAYLVDPYWNPAVEAQAIDRIHRMGQKRPVIAMRLMMKDSIEDRMDKIQRKKSDLASMSLKKLSRKELMEQKANDIAELFK